MVKDAILADAGVWALVSDRMYASILPTNTTFPALSYFLAWERRFCSGSWLARIQVSAWSYSYAQLVDLQGALWGWSRTRTDVVVTVGVERYEDESRLHHVPVNIDILYDDGG